jgi:hypothetical protein
VEAEPVAALIGHGAPLGLQPATHSRFAGVIRRSLSFVNLGWPKE